MNTQRPGMEDMERPLELLDRESVERVSGGFITCSGERTPKGELAGWGPMGIASPRDAAGRGTQIGGTADEGI